LIYFIYKLKLVCQCVVGMYQDIVLAQLPYQEFGFRSAADFVLQKMADVARVKT